MKPRMPIPGIIVILSVLWLVLLGVTLWAAVIVWSAPLPGSSDSGAAAAVTMTWNSDAFKRFLEKVQWAGLGLAGLMVVAVVIGAAVQEKSRKRRE